MKSAVINSGSSSIKFSLFEDEKLLKHLVFEEVKSHHKTLEELFEIIDINSLLFVAHRVVHGGEKFIKPTIIDKTNIKTLKSISNLAPLHNPANIEAIEYFLDKNPKLLQIAVFDTAFHQSMPKEAFLYGIDKKFYKNNNIRRYGFHGSSHAYLLEEASKLLSKEKPNLITLHLGNGASITAIKEAKSIDTSMGFTPLEGLLMGTRSGDIDGGIILYMLEELNLSIDEVKYELNKNGGLKGLCQTNDIREILKKDTNDKKEALKIYINRIKKYLGSYMAILDKIDGIVFSGGVGENSFEIRKEVLKSFEKFGIYIDDELNKKNDTIISTNKSSIKVFVIKTDEELQILKEAKRICIGN